MNFLCRCCRSRVEKKTPFEFMADAGLHKTAYHMEWELFGEVEEVWTEYEDEHRLIRTWTGQGDVGEQQFLYTKRRSSCGTRTSSRRRI